MEGEGEGDGVKMDKWGYPIKTSSDACVSAINAYYHQVLIYGREASVILEAPLQDENCVLANTLAANYLSSSNPSKSSFHLSSAQSRLDQSTDYEKAVFESISCLIAKNRDDDVAVDSHSKLLKQFPRDLASLKRAQLLCFYMGRPDILLNLIEQVLPHNQQENYIYGILAFALLELGRMAEAEEAARKGLEINMQDLWSQHCLCHVFQYACRFKEAVEFMEECSSSWSSCSSFMYTHNWWHVAVCYLEGNAPIDKVLKVYDQRICKELLRSGASCVEVYLNALALLLRVYVRGQMGFFENHLNNMADRLMNQSTWNLEWHLDILILWALASTNKIAKAEELFITMKSRFYSMATKKQQSMQRGILLAEALYEYGRGNYEKAFELLGPDFDASDFKMIGASEEQLDVFNEVWYCVLLNTGRFLKAIEEIEKRMKKTNGIPFLWRLLDSLDEFSNAEGYNAKGDIFELHLKIFTTTFTGLVDTYGGSLHTILEPTSIRGSGPVIHKVQWTERGYSMTGREDTSVISEKARALQTAYF